MLVREFDVDSVLAVMGRCSQCQALGGCECDELRVAEMERFAVDTRDNVDCELVGDMLELIDREEAMLREFEAEGGAA